MIKREWKTDKRSFVTETLINDYEGWNDKKPIEDPLENENISMQDKYDMLDNWRYYQDCDPNEKIEHPEYMIMGGKTKYIKFRKRQSVIKYEKEEKRVARKTSLNKKISGYKQLNFSF